MPTIWLQGLWDQEDMWGAIHSYLAVEPKDAANDKNFLIMGPWSHSQINRDGTTLGPLRWNGDTTLEVRRDVIKPFFDQYLKDGTPKADTPPVLIYNTGENHWDRFTSWPLRHVESRAVSRRRLRAVVHGADAARDSASAYDEYVSDPAKPVPYMPRPTRFSDTDSWRRWLVSDQRAVVDRPDVLAYATPPLTEPVRISGAPVVHLVASTSGTDSDWVVKLIDVYPDEVPSQPEMGGYQLADRHGHLPRPLSRKLRASAGDRAQQAAAVHLRAADGQPRLQPGHRIMVQVQSTWFPLYDRNPQTFVPNIFFAKPSDYTKATQRIFHAAGVSTRIDLPVVEKH